MMMMVWWRVWNSPRRQCGESELGCGLGLDDVLGAEAVITFSSPSLGMLSLSLMLRRKARNGILRLATLAFLKSKLPLAPRDTPTPQTRERPR